MTAPGILLAVVQKGTRNNNHLMCRVQSLFDSLGDEVKGKALGLGGDGRYFNKEAVQTILRLAAGAGVKKVCPSNCHHVAGLIMHS